jgi:hypothetical protein
MTHNVLEIYKILHVILQIWSIKLLNWPPHERIRFLQVGSGMGIWQWTDIDLSCCLSKYCHKVILLSNFVKRALEYYIHTRRNHAELRRKLVQWPLIPFLLLQGSNHVWNICKTDPRYW